MPQNALDYLKAFIDSRDLADLIPYREFLNATTCSLKTEGVCAAFRLDPVDDECLSPAEKALEVANLLAAENILDDSYRQYQYLFRTRRYSLRDRTNGNHTASVRQMETRHIEHLKRSSKGATIEAFQILEALPHFSAKQLARLPQKDRQAELRKLHAEFDLTARSYQTCLDNVNLKRLDEQGAFKLFYRLLHPGDAWEDAPDYNPSQPVDEQLRRASVAWDKNHDCLRVGQRAVRVFVLHTFPDNSSANFFGDLLKIDADFTLVTTWQPEDRVLAHDQLIRLRTMMINLERQGLSASRAIRQDPTLREALQDCGVRDDLSQINDLLSQIREKRHTGRYSLTLLLHAETPAELEQPAAELRKAFQLKGAQLDEERQQYVFGTVLPVFFGTFPGHAHLNVRWLPLRDDNHADLATIWAPNTGEPPASNYAAVYETRQGPLHHVARKYFLVGNRCKFGRTRTGKTVDEIHRIASAQVYHPITRIYDAGQSYLPVAAYFGGDVFHISLADWKKKTSPFVGPEDDPDFRHFSGEFVRFLIEAEGYEMTDDDSLQLGEWITGLFRLDPEQRTLTTLYGVLEGPMKRPLSRWIRGNDRIPPGQYGALFDNAVDELVDSEFRVTEFEKVVDGVRRVWLEALLLLLIYRDFQAITDPANLDRPKFFTFDECASLWQHPRMAAQVKRILTAMTKKNSSLSLVMQSPAQLGELEPFVKENCTSFQFFPNPHISDAMLATFGLDETRTEIFRHLKNREHLFHAQLGEGRDLWKVLRLNSLDPFRYWMSTTTPEDVVQRERVFRQVGPLKGLEELAAKGAA